MDYTGIGPFTRYKLNRALTDDERARQLKMEVQASSEAQDWLSVIKINSTFLELVDRWYPVKGWWVWMGCLLGIPCASFAIAILFVVFKQNEVGGWALAAVFVPMFGGLSWAGLLMVRTEAFRLTHYPIRLNRKTRTVYAFRPDGSVIEAPWDDLFLTVVSNELPMWQSSEDVRAHILYDDAETVKDTFTLAYPFLGDEAGLMRLWEYVRRYMEDSDGVERASRSTELCMPVDGRREGLLFGIVRTFAPYVRWPAVQLLGSPLWALTVLGRWVAMQTSKVPIWPDDVEAACQVNDGDQYQKDWRSNGKYDFFELWWPLVCFVIGLTIVGAGIAWLVSVAT